jgi:hypothetical protein
VFALDKFEKSPLEYARENGHHKIAEQLEGKQSQCTDLLQLLHNYQVYLNTSS